MSVSYHRMVLARTAFSSCMSNISKPLWLGLNTLQGSRRYHVPLSVAQTRHARPQPLLIDCHGAQPGSCAFLRKHHQLLSRFLAATLQSPRQAHLLSHLLPAFLDAHMALRHNHPGGTRLCQVRAAL